MAGNVFSQNESVNIGISNRHVHLSEQDKEILFGKGYKLTYVKSLSQTGQFAALEMVTAIGHKGTIENIRILGPERKETQVEISRTDMYRLGVNAPVRDSGDLDGTPGIVLIGPMGMVTLGKGVICAKRHIHLSHLDADGFGLADKDEVMVKVNNERGLIFNNVLIRVHESFVKELHLDTDEANAAGLNNYDRASIIK